MAPLDAFRHAMARPQDEVRLDELCFLIAQQANPSLVLPAAVDRLDALAASCPSGSAADLVGHLAELGFRGDPDHYHDPRNSYLDAVIERRLGIPITLSVVAICMGRRVGVPLTAIGMPGHFLVGDATCPGRYFDPFRGGAELDVDGCRARFHAVHGDDAPFDPAFLAPVDDRAIIARMLRNLRQVFEASGRSEHLEWVLRFRSAMPDAAPEERAQLAGVLAVMGRYGEAADLLEALAVTEGEATAATFRWSALRMRARLN